MCGAQQLMVATFSIMRRKLVWYNKTKRNREERKCPWAQCFWGLAICMDMFYKYQYPSINCFDFAEACLLWISVTWNQNRPIHLTSWLLAILTMRPQLRSCQNSVLLWLTILLALLGWGGGHGRELALRPYPTGNIWFSGKTIDCPDTMARAICTHTPTLPAGPPGLCPCSIPFKVKTRSVKEIWFFGCQWNESRKGRLKFTKAPLWGSWWEAEKELGEVFYAKIKEIGHDSLLLPKILSVV